MRHSNHTFQTLICSLIISASCLHGSVKLQVREGRPIVDGVYVNGHGPYRFLVDTGANVNLIETGLARKIGMSTTSQTALTSAAGKVQVSESDGNEVTLDSTEANDQKFVISGLDAIHNSSPDVQGVLGEWFLARFDYTLDLHRKRLEFGKQDRTGTRSTFKMINARPVVSTSLGDLALDSGAARVTLFGIRADGGDFRMEFRTVAGAQKIGVASGKPLVIDGRRIWNGDALAIPGRPEPGVDGLLPLALFTAVYVCNSEGYVIFE
jgi:predicted aspartyl protease